MAGPLPPAPGPEGPAVQRWCRLGLVGPPALAAALRVLSPRAGAGSGPGSPGEPQRQLLSLVQGLRDEGCAPTVLRSRDVYGYTSCTCRVPPPAAKAQPAASASSTPPPPPPHHKPAVPRRPHGWLRPPAPGVRLGGGRRARTRAQPEPRGLEPGRRERDSPRPRDRPRPRDQARLQLLRSKVIRVDAAPSDDDEVRRKAQRILRLNLSPVIRIRPLAAPNPR